MSLAAVRSIFRAQRSSRLLCLALARRGYADEAAAGSLSLTFGTPSQVFFNEVGVTQVDVPSMTGNFGILPNHVPILSVLKPGIVTVYTGNSTEKYFVSSGSITVNKDSSAQILAEEAAPLSDLDVHAAKQGLEASQTLLSTSSTEEERAKAIIAIEFHEALIKSLEQGV